MYNLLLSASSQTSRHKTNERTSFIFNLYEERIESSTFHQGGAESLGMRGLCVCVSRMPWNVRPYRYIVRLWGSVFVRPYMFEALYDVRPCDFESICLSRNVNVKPCVCESMCISWTVDVGPCVWESICMSGTVNVRPFGCEDLCLWSYMCI